MDLVLDEGTVQWWGRIDRVDEGEGRFRVIDYKTGRPRGEPDVASGQSLQLAVYLMAAAALLERDPTEGEALYRYVTSLPAGKEERLDGRKWDTIEEALRAAVSVILKGIQEGTFPSLPTKGCESGCPYGDACRGRDAILERKREDPRVQALLGLRDREAD